MKKGLLILVVGFLMMFPRYVKASEPFIHRCEATAYSYTGSLTASQTVPTENRTAAGMIEWRGSTIIVWLDDGDGIIKAGNYIGTYIIEDTAGPDSKIRKGECIDIYIHNEIDAKAFGRKNVIIQIIDTKG